MEKFTLMKSTAEELVDWKGQYLQQLAAPNDGMWQSFVDQATHYRISCDQQIAGYCVINAEGKMLQFYVADAVQAQSVFRPVLEELNVGGAFAATSESQYLSLSMDNQKSVAVNALLYELDGQRTIEEAVFPVQSRFLLMKENELESAVSFGVETLNADPDWLRSYFAE